MRDATHVTPSIDTVRIPSDSATSPIGRLPAAHRTGIAIGALNGIIDNVTDSVDPGSLSIANMLMNEATRSITTGCCACRASCSLEDIAPTAENMAEYSKNPPRKYKPKTTAVLAVTCGIWKNPASLAPPPGKCRRCERISLVDTPQIKN